MPAPQGCAAREGSDCCCQLGKWSLKWRVLGEASPSVFFPFFFFFYKEIESFETLHLPGDFVSHLFSGVIIFILPLIPHSLAAFLGSAPSLPTAFSLPLLDKLQQRLPRLRKVGLDRAGQGCWLVRERAARRKCGRSWVYFGDRPRVPCPLLGALTRAPAVPRTPALLVEEGRSWKSPVQNSKRCIIVFQPGTWKLCGFVFSFPSLFFFF